MEPVVHTGDGVAAAEVANVLVMLWQKPASAARWNWQVKLLEQMALHENEGVLLLNIILSTSTPPDAALRKQMTTYLKSSGTRMRKLIAVPLGDSVWQSVVRTIIRGVALISGVSDRQVVVATIAEAIAVTREQGGRASAAELERAVGLVTAALDVNGSARAAPPRSPAGPV